MNFAEPFRGLGAFEQLQAFLLECAQLLSCCSKTLELAAYPCAKPWSHTFAIRQAERVECLQELPVAHFNLHTMSDK